MHELLKMKRQGRGYYADLLGDDTGRQPGGTTGHEKPEQLEPVLLGQGAERGDCAFLIHRLPQNFNVSTKIEFVDSKRVCHAHFANYRNYLP